MACCHTQWSSRSCLSVGSLWGSKSSRRLRNLRTLLAWLQPREEERADEQVIILAFSLQCCAFDLELVHIRAQKKQKKKPNLSPLWGSKNRYCAT